jgi:hypothetical protein
MLFDNDPMDFMNVVKENQHVSDEELVEIILRNPGKFNVGL